MAVVTFANMVDAAFSALGKADAGEDRVPVFQDLLEFYGFDLPMKSGAQYARGKKSLTVGTVGVYTGDAVAGEYAFPPLLASCSGIARLVPDVALGGASEAWQFPIFTDATSFYLDTPQTGNGKPTRALLLGRTITFDPIPSPTSWYGTVLMVGTVYEDTSSIVEGAPVPRQEWVPALRAYATALVAQRYRRFDVAQTWFSIADQRARVPAAASLSSVQSIASTMADF